MPKTKISEFSATPGNNTDIDGINIGEGCAPSGINDAIRELMAQLKDFQAGTAGDSFNGPVGTTTPAAGAFTTLSASSTTTLSGLTASTALALDASKNVTSVTNTGTGNNVLATSPTLVTPNLGTPSAVTLTNATGLPISTGVTGMAAGAATFLVTPSSANLASLVTDETGTGALVFAGSPTFTGTVNGAALTLSSSLTLSGGTANGVAYLNGSKVLTTGSALSFDGTNFNVIRSAATDQYMSLYADGTGPTFKFFGGAAGKTAGIVADSASASMYFTNEGNKPFVYAINGSEQMRLTSTGLGIGTSSPGAKLHVVGTGTYAATFNNNSDDVRLELQRGGTQYAQISASTTSLNLVGSQSNTAIKFLLNGGTVTAVTLDADRNLLLNGTSAGASSVGTFAIFNGTAPTGSVTNGIILYAEDVSSSSELKVRDEAGNVTTLSPHNFSLIPDGPSEDMAWAYYSEKGGKRINVDMLKLARMVEKLTGEKLVYES